MSRNNIQQYVKKQELITIIVAALFPNSRLVLCWIFSYDFPKIRNLPKVFLKSFENVAPGYKVCKSRDRPQRSSKKWPLCVSGVTLKPYSAQHIDASQSFG